jgi:hypothetical protein
MIGNAELFELGYRDAFLCSLEGKRDKEFFYSLSERFPFYEDYIVEGEEKKPLRFFFRDIKTKDYYVEKGMFESDVVTEKNGRTFTLPYNSRILGEALGFPPIAIEDFEKGILPKNKYLIDYHGLTFILERSHVKKALRYLEKTMPIHPNLAEMFNSKIEIYRYTEDLGFLIVSNENSNLLKLKTFFSSFSKLISIKQ